MQDTGHCSKHNANCQTAKRCDKMTKERKRVGTRRKTMDVK